MLSGDSNRNIQTNSRSNSQKKKQLWMYSTLVLYICLLLFFTMTV